MTAEERYEWAWKRYLVRLNENSKIRLTSFLREIHTGLYKGLPGSLPV